MTQCAALETRPMGAGYLTPSNDLSLFLKHTRQLAPSQISLILAQDIEDIEHAFSLASLLKQMNPEQLAEYYLPDDFIKLFKQAERSLLFDHIGLEVFSAVESLKEPIKTYIVKNPIETHQFKSVQTLEFIQTYTPELKQVDIMHVKAESGEKIELFCCHQSYLYTLLRKSNRQLLQADECIMPLNHIAFRVTDLKLLEAIHRWVSLGKSPGKNLGKTQSQLLGRGIYHNPGDNSYNLKILTQKKSSLPSGQVLEFIL